MKTDKVEEAEALLCRCLRTKAAFGSVVGEEAWQLGDSSTAVYWCLATMEPVGPDEAPVDVHACRAGRRCFRARE
jgi:hypothetical protein